MNARSSPRNKSAGFEQWIIVLLLAVVISLVYWPGLYGFWGRDDFAQLAYVRLLGTPWTLFIHDHYPVGGSIFRPLGFASLWFTQWLFGNDYWSNSLADLILHIAVSWACLRVIQVTAIPFWLALPCSLLFALHPAVIGTALWWSARFDLLATFFSLVALRYAFDHMRSPRLVTLTLVLLAVLAAVLSKEVGLAVLVPISILWLKSAMTGTGQRAVMFRSLLSLWALALAYFAWRWMVLGTPASELTGSMPLGTAIAKGSVDWLEYLPGYLSFWARLMPVQQGLLVLSIALVVLFSVCALWCNCHRLWQDRPGELMLSGLCLFVLPGLLQSPVVALNGMPLQPDVSAVQIAMQSRLYYLSISGAVLMLAALLAAVWKVRRSVVAIRWEILLSIALVAIVANFALVARQTAEAYALRSMTISRVARAAVTALDNYTLPTSQCHVYFLGIEPSAEWDIYVSLDSIVKALSPDLGRVEHCLFHSDYRTFFYLFRRNAVDADDIAPYRSATLDTAHSSWLRIGDAEIASLLPPEELGPQDLQNGLFLLYENENDRFRDVSAEVANGQRKVRPH